MIRHHVSFDQDSPDQHQAWAIVAILFFNEASTQDIELDVQATEGVERCTAMTSHADLGLTK
jgi:hypothetical protein